MEQDDETILREKGYYSICTGVTIKAIATDDVISVQVLHALLRSFGHYMKTVVHIHARVFLWCQSKPSAYNHFLKNVKQEIQSVVTVKTWIPWNF